MTDVMWASPEGERTLYAPDDGAAAFISAVYAFDRVEVVPVQARGGERGVSVSIGAGDDRTVDLAAGSGWRILGRRPAWFTRLVEGPVARATLGVRTYGTSPSGVREWYRAGVWRPVVTGQGTVNGEDLGPLVPVDPPAGFGFSEPPRRPSVVTVRPLLEDPIGRLDTVISQWATARRGGRD